MVLHSNCGWEVEHIKLFTCEIFLHPAHHVIQQVLVQWLGLAALERVHHAPPIFIAQFHVIVVGVADQQLAPAGVEVAPEYILVLPLLTRHDVRVFLVHCYFVEAVEYFLVDDQNLLALWGRALIAAQCSSVVGNSLDLLLRKYHGNFGIILRKDYVKWMELSPCKYFLLKGSHCQWDGVELEEVDTAISVPNNNVLGFAQLDDHRVILKLLHSYNFSLLDVPQHEVLPGAWVGNHQVILGVEQHRPAERCRQVVEMADEIQLQLLGQLVLVHLPNWLLNLLLIVLRLHAA